MFTAFVGDPQASTRELDAALDRSDALRAMRALPERERVLLVGKYYVGRVTMEAWRSLGPRQNRSSRARRR